MKIVIMGYSGSGKSSLARYLSKKYGISVLYLDQVHHLENWQERKQEEETLILESFLNHHDSWIIDGNYFKLLLSRRLEEADVIIELLLPRFQALYRIIRRYCRYYGQIRPDMAKGCPEKLDWEFVKWILWSGRTKEKREVYRHIAKMYHDKVTVCYCQKHIDKLKQTFRQK